MNEIRRYIRRILPVVFLLLAGGVMNVSWAAKVTYHILTLPIDPTVYDYHMKSAVTGHRLEAVKIVVDNQTTVELPAHYKSPLATGFTYYAPSEITIGSTIQLYTNNSNTKGTLYDVKGGAIPIAEGTTIPGSTAEYYVVYTYNASNTIAQLNGLVSYNIGIKGKGYLAYNRGRNNRPAVVPTAKVDPEMLASPDFMKVDNPGGGISTYWIDGNNKNPEAKTGSQFHFIFQFEGLDPYNIIISTAYNKDSTFIEKNENTSNEFVYKWYKGGQMISVGAANNCFLTSDIHKKYNTPWNSAIPNPTNPTYTVMDGYLHGLTKGAIWGSVALLNNTTNTGYVFMGTRTVDGNGAVPTPGDDNKYYYLKFDNNNLTFNKLTAADATKSYSTEGIYPIKKVTFKVPTPFYDPASPSDDNIVSVEDWVSQYTVDNDPIETKYLPTSLRRKYCTFNGKFYRDAERTDEITHFSQATEDPTEGYQVYLGYDVSASIPFKAISPSASYTTATWYELTDAGSTQEYGRKIKNNSGTYKNNGANGEYVKESEFAFVGDPYELKVLYRKGTEDASSNTYVTLSTYDTWQIPMDAVAGSFLLQKYKDTGYWNWDTGQPTDAVTYQSNLSHSAGKDAQTITFTVSGLSGSKYIQVTTSGTDAAQIVSVTPTAGTVVAETGTSATVTVKLAENTGVSAKTMTVTIQEYNSSDGTGASGTASIITITQGTSSASYAGNTVDYHATNSTYVKPMELPEYTFIYNIVDNAGNIAIKGSATQTIFSTLTSGSIPSTIFSPFLVGETLTFYDTYSGGGRSNLSGSITQTPPTNNANIYVSYTTYYLASKSIHLDDDQRFKVQLNGEYLYYDTESNKVLSTEAIGAGDYYSWQLEGQDPYAMKIKNVGKGEYVKVASWENDQALGFDADIDDASRFIAMLSNYGGIYEVMAATGDNAPYLYIARPSTTGAEATIYNYTHGADQLRFVLSGEQPVYYHLIDKAGEELLIASSYNARLTLPAEYVSPLVDTYYYYPTSALAAADISSGNHTGSISEITDDKNEDGTQTDGKGDNHVYVTYTVNDLIGFNNTGRVNDHPYLLKFLEPYADGYYLEDGNDKLIPYNASAADGKEGRIQARYPYCNGDGNLNIYSEAMRDEQMNGGSSTRPRWVWFFESANNDPYHVRIHSRSTISYKGVSNYTYLETKAVHFNQDSDPDIEHIVTGGALPGVASETPTEYMILGLAGVYKLLTTNEISADENGDGTIDGSETKRRSVTSFEQYWKTYNMLKLHVLGVSASTDAYSTDELTWVVPNDPFTTYNADHDPDLTYREYLYQVKDWHSYDAYANAVRWNGYNDKETGHTSKVVEKLEHWFQTFDMGNGTFDVESADIPPVLILLDQHGWEIMRKPLPVANYPEGDEELAALRVYDSPLVDKYYFYSNATKASGCHKYTLRMQDGKERDQITVDGVHYSSSSLGNLPPANAKGVKSSGVLNDQFVIYTVKEEFAGNYAYSLVYSGDKDAGYTITSETGTSQPYIVLQNGRFYKTQNSKSPNTSYISKPVIEHTNPEGGNVNDMIVSPHNHGANNDNIIDGSGNFIGNNFWYVKPNLNIDEEMGIIWGSANSGAEPLTKAATQVTYKDKTGFDPYNMQLQLVKNNDGSDANKYLTTHMTSAQRINGVLVGSYTGEDYYHNAGSTLITLEDKFTAYAPSTNKGSEGYDHTNLQISNQTFMAVSDANGNMQLMPRFDHTKRVSLNKVSPWETQLTDPENHAKASADNNNSQGAQTTFFVRPQRFIYHIIDNQGREALRYTRGGDNYPAITNHFKSPIATDFTYYKGLAVYTSPVSSDVGAWAAATGDFKRTATSEALFNTLINLLPTAGTYQYRIGTRGNFSYYSVVVSKGLLEQQITGSFAAAEYLNNVEFDVYVRYNYDEEADHEGDRILEGQWFTVKLANKDLQSEGTVLKYTQTVATDAYATAKAALSADGVYYFRIGTGPFTYKKVTKSGASITEEDSSESVWTSVLGLGVNLYAGEASSRSLTATDATDLDAQADKLTETGDYYFRVGTESSYSYYKVTVSTAYDESTSTDAVHTDELDDGSKGYDTNWSNSKPLVVDADDKKWQWKFRTAPADPSSDYYNIPDPYAIQLFNRQSNYTTNPSLQPSPMDVGIKVPNSESLGVDRFALLSHPSGGYALVAAKTYTDSYYRFLNGANMTIPSTTAADTLTETGFTYKTGAITNGAQLIVDDDITYHYTYYVINNSSKLAITAEQNNAEATSHEFNPYLPESAQTLLLNMEDYLYYGFAARDIHSTPEDPSDDTYSVIPQTILFTLYGLYDDVVYVRYKAYDVDKTNYKVPNKKTTVDSHVARHTDSHDASMNINGGLPYNIIWYNNNMMESDDDVNIIDAGDHALDGDAKYVWYFKGNDPYGLEIEHKQTGYYINGTATLASAESGAKQFMLLKKSGYDYGVLAVTGDKDKMLSFDDDDSNPSTAPVVSLKSTPNKFIIFGLSVHDLIYRLIIAKSCANKTSPGSGEYVDIPYREGDEDDYTSSYEWSGNESKRIFGTTQRNLTAKKDDDDANPVGSKYQLGSTVSWGGTGHIYSKNVGTVSIGDDLWVPNEFYRPNCTFEFYVEGVYSTDGTTADTELNNRFKGLKLTKLMSASDLIDKTVVVNIVYKFNDTLATNTGMGFVTSTNQNLWYTFETPVGTTPYLAHYTNAWGLQAMEGEATRYTNDYLWTPLGDVYGFKMYNRYMMKNSNGGSGTVMTMNNIAEGKNLFMAVPGTTTRPAEDGGGVIPADYGIFELITGDQTGYFRVHPMVNNSGTQYYVRRGGSNYAVLSTTPSDWAFGLDMTLLEPYYERAGYVGGLTPEGKTAYETARDKDPFHIVDLQAIVYNDDYIIKYTPGYYRLHNQPGVSGIRPVRYASGYLHDIEKTAISGGISMHFYSRENVTTTFEGEDGLGTGFTETVATRGDIPVPATEYDPSTVFYFVGNGTVKDSYNNPTSTMQTQGLYVKGNVPKIVVDEAEVDDPDHGLAVMTATSGEATTFSLMDIGGAVLLIHDGSAPASRKYFNFSQSYTVSGDNKIYDLKYFHNSPTDDAKWCMQPVQKTATAGNGEMPLMIATNNGGDGYYYATFCAPFDVLLPNDVAADPSNSITAKTYNAYICKKWYAEGVNPSPVPARGDYLEGKFVPAGTPVIIRVKDESGSVKLTLPSTSPSSSLSCIFSGSYLEKLLAASNPANDVFTFGLPMTSDVSKDGDYVTSGGLTAPLPEFANNGVGFYINANPNKEHDPLESMWKRNNLYVQHNKIYYRATGGGSGAPERNNVLFVPVLFDDGEEQQEEDPGGPEQDENNRRKGDGCVYDLLGRKVASAEEVKAGTWYRHLSPGVYIVNGQKVFVGVRRM